MPTTDASEHDGSDATVARPFGLTPREHRRLADILLDAARKRKPIDPFSMRYPEITIDDALRVRDTLLARRLSSGERLVGAKVSHGSAVGADAPGRRVAWVTSGMLLSTDVVALASLIRPRVEAKLAFRLSRHLGGQRVTADALLAATDRVLPALEVLDDRYNGSRVAPVDEIADNCGAALVRIGMGGPPPGPDAIERLPYELEVDHDADVEPAPACTRATVAPLASTVWLAQRLIDAGRAPAAGTLLLSPAGVTAVVLRGGTRVRARCGKLGSVELCTTSAAVEEDGHEH